MDKLQEAAEYFRQNPVWKKIFEGFQKKYASYDSFSGTVVLRGLKKTEIEELEGFFGRSFHGQKSISISAEKFQKALNRTRFAPVKAQEVVEAYFGEKLVGKKSQRIAVEDARREILEKILEEKCGVCCGKLREEAAYYEDGELDEKDKENDTVRETVAKEYKDEQYVGERKGDATYEQIGGERIKNDITDLSNWLWGSRTKDLQEWERQLQLSIRILEMLPVHIGSTRYLAVFAAEVTGNPHAFDRGTADGELLYQVIQGGWRKSKKAEKTALQPDHSIHDDVADRFNNKSGKNAEETISSANIMFPALERQKIYLKAGILLDEISNYCMISGILAWKKDGTPHAGMNGFCQEGDCVQVPLSVLAKWGKIDCLNKKLYTVENPSIFAAICEKKKGTCACMCMNGQPRLASILLLDLAAQAGIRICYAGDFDPEGLLIAQKVIQYYKGEAEYWHMTVEDYEQSRSEEKISEKRLAMLERITDERLLPVAERIRELGVAGYQERLIEKYIDLK